MESPTPPANTPPPVEPYYVPLADEVEIFEAAFDARLARAATTVEVLLAYEDGATLAWLYDHGEVMARQDDDAGMHLTVRLDPANAARFEQRHGGGSPS